MSEMTNKQLISTSGKEVNSHYPRLVVDLEKLKNNIDTAIKECGDKGIKIAGVIKGFHGIEPAIRAYLDSELEEIASSRMEQLIRVRELGWTKTLTLIRVPMLSEVHEVVEFADMSLNSEVKVLKALNDEALKQGKVHKVVLMADLGDLREGFWDKDEMVDVATEVEENMPGLRLMGIGTNLGCYGALVPTAEKIDELTPIAEAIEARIGRELEIVSGGASTSYMRINDDDMPKKVNHLRLGENIIHARDNEVYHGKTTDPMFQNVFTLFAEVIEVKDKPTYPVGKIHVNAFGGMPEYEDRGIRKRALVAVGRVDLGDFSDIFPCMEGLEVLGGSSDHLILDVQEAFDKGKEVQVGDILEFNVNYGSLVFLTGSENIKIEAK